MASSSNHKSSSSNSIRMSSNSNSNQNSSSRPDGRSSSFDIGHGSDDDCDNYTDLSPPTTARNKKSRLLKPLLSANWDSIWRSFGKQPNKMAAPATATAAPVATTTSSSQEPSDPPQRNQWMALLFGQVLALLVASTNASSYTLSHHFHVQTEFFQMFLVYLLLSLCLFKRPAITDHTDMEHSSRNNSNAHSGPVYTLPGTRLRLRIQWWIYLMYSLLDVLPNIMTLISFRYTSLTSTTLLGSLMAPSTMFFSVFVLAKVFRSHHYLGVAMCVLGGCLTVWSDVDSSPSTSAPDTAAADAIAQAAHRSMEDTPTFLMPGADGVDVMAAVDLTASSLATDAIVNRPLSYVGDLLAIGAALLYGLGDALAEFSIKNVDKDEYLGMLGLFGSIFTGLVFPWLEREAVEDLDRPDLGDRMRIAAVLLWYILSVVGYYIGIGAFLQHSDATLLNLSLQAANLWVILFSWIVYSELPPPSFFFALILISAGVYYYEIRGRQLEQAEDKASFIALSASASSLNLEYQDLMSGKDTSESENDGEPDNDDALTK